MSHPVISERSKMLEETSMCSRKRVRCGARDKDIISNLPDELKVDIIGRLSTKEAVRTCILSRKWTSTWMSIPELKFLHPQRYEEPSRYAEMVDMVLSLHQGPIRKFTVAIEEEFYSAVDRWMLLLSRNGIEELFIENMRISSRGYTIPEIFYSCQLLRRVRLNFCDLHLPPSFAGFRVLRTIKFEGVSASDDNLCRLIASCPLLENLHLESFISKGTIWFNAPRLRFLVMRNCSFVQIKLKTPSLVTGKLELDYIRSAEVPRANNLIETLGCLSRIKQLKINGYFMKYLSLAKSLGDKLPSTFNHLEALRLTMDISDSREALAAICIFENSPMLQKLKIECRDKDYTALRNPELWKSREKISFKHLKVAVITCFDESDLAYDFVKLLLVSAPALKELHVRGLFDGPQTVKNLSCFEKASADVKFRSRAEFMAYN